MEARHGGHQVAQNSTMYALPFWKSFTGSPCTHLPGANLGAGSPTLREAAAAKGSIVPAARARNAAVRLSCLVFILLIIHQGRPKVSLKEVGVHPSQAEPARGDEPGPSLLDQHLNACPASDGLPIKTPLMRPTHLLLCLWLVCCSGAMAADRKSTRLNSSH